MSQPRILALSRLQEGIPAIPPAAGITMIEACMVCFGGQGHNSGVELKVLGSYGEAFTVEWEGEVTDWMRRYWADEEFTTEQAAYGLAILLMEELTGYTAVGKAAKGGGFDFWLGRYDETAEVKVQYTARLEVSGIRRGNSKRIAARIAEKKRQVAVSNGTHPAYIVVVDFSGPIAWVVRK